MTDRIIRIIVYKTFAQFPKKRGMAIVFLRYQFRAFVKKQAIFILVTNPYQQPDVLIPINVPVYIGILSKKDVPPTRQYRNSCTIQIRNQSRV